MDIEICIYCDKVVEKDTPTVIVDKWYLSHRECYDDAERLALLVTKAQHHKYYCRYKW
jgi:hypothetical protein